MGSLDTIAFGETSKLPNWNHASTLYLAPCLESRHSLFFSHNFPAFLVELPSLLGGCTGRLPEVTGAIRNLFFCAVLEAVQLQSIGVTLYGVTKRNVKIQAIALGFLGIRIRMELTLVAYQASGHVKWSVS